MNGKAERLQRITTINTVYSLGILIPGMIACAVWASTGGWGFLAIPALVLLFIPKFMITARWDALHKELRGELGL